jgi:hypothetical protein
MLTSAISFTMKDDVLVAMMAPGLAISPRRLKKDRLIGRFSAIASMIKSALATAVTSVVAWIRAMGPETAAAAAASSIVPFATALLASWVNDPLICFSALSQAAWFMSTATTLYPAEAQSCTTPWPMLPRPQTATVAPVWRSAAWRLAAARQAARDAERASMESILDRVTTWLAQPFFCGSRRSIFFHAPPYSYSLYSST